MRLDYEVLWFEDNLSWFQTSRLYIEDFLSEAGFNLVTYQYENDNEGLEEIIKKHDFDLVLMDYNLVGKNGDELIERIRELNIYTDIVFYSQNGAQSIRDIIRSKGIDGIFCSGRDIEEFEEKVNGVIGNTIKKVQNVNNIRGLVIAETIDLENTLEDIIREFFKTEPGIVMDPRKEELLSKVYTKKIDQIKKGIEDIDSISKKSIEMLIDEDILTAYNFYTAILSILKEEIKSINTDLQKKLDDEKRIVLEERKNLLTALKKTLLDFDDDIIKTRNTLAHVQEKKDESGVSYLESLNKHGTKIILDSEKYTEIRRELRKHGVNLREIKEVFSTISLAEVASSVESDSSC